MKFIEQNYPDMLDVPSTVKSPMQIFSTIAKDIWAKELGYEEKVTVVGIMPCLAKKCKPLVLNFQEDPVTLPPIPSLSQVPPNFLPLVPQLPTSQPANPVFISVEETPVLLLQNSGHDALLHSA